MAIVKYPFRPQIGQNPYTKEIELILQPKIPIFLKINSFLYPFKIEPHVDSGATRNLFPADPLAYLGIALENKRKRKHFGIGGHEVISYTHEVEILIDNYSFITEIDFSRDHKPPLLGVEGFFRFFDSVKFDMTNNQMEFTYRLKN